MNGEQGLTRRAALLAGLAGTAGLTAAGCGRNRPARDAATPRTISLAHQYGETAVPRRPKLVATMSGSWTDALLALEVPIVAEYVSRGYAGRDNRFAWTPEHDSEVVEMTNITEVGLERLAAFDLDLILAGYVANEQMYQRLNEVAPTVPVMDRNAVLDTWQDITTIAGRIFGREAEARKLVADVERQVAAFRDEFPSGKGTTFAFGQLTADRQFGFVTDESDPAAKLIASTGPRLDPKLRSVAEGETRVLVSRERMDLLRADLLLMWPLAGGPKQFAEIPGWNALPAVRNEAVVFLNNDNAAAFGNPTIYSVPYALDKLRPAFRALGG